MEQSHPPILTGIDIPFRPNCGSLILADDFYGKWKGQVSFVSLWDREPKAWSSLKRRRALHLLHDAGMKLQGGTAYHRFLKDKLKTVLSAMPLDVRIHVHHLTFGMAGVLREFDCQEPMIGFCHGTDVIAAMTNRETLNDVRRTCARLKYIVFPTHAIKQQLVALGCDPGSKAQIIPWGLPSWLLAPTTREKVGNDKKHPSVFRILFAGRTNANKGLHLLQQSLLKLPKSFSVDAYCASIGTNVEGSVVPVSTSQHFRVHPFVSRRVLASLFDMYDCLVIPTVTLEAFCLTALEGQARGIPIIASGLPVLREVLGEGALYFRPGDAEDLTANLNELATNAALRQSLSRRGRDNAEKYPIQKLLNAIYTLSVKL